MKVNIKLGGLSAFGDSNSESAKLVSNLMKWDPNSNKLLSDMSYFDYHISTSNSYNRKLEDLLGPCSESIFPLLLEIKIFKDMQI